VLEYWHQNAIWYFDIRLENVLLMLRKSKGIWDVVLGDFGLAFVINEEYDREFAGIPQFTASERWLG
jgi:hypothetical protein